MVARIVFTFIAVLILNSCISEKSVSQDVPQASIEDFSFLLGSWNGSLEYLNFGDDKTLVTLPTRAVYSQEKDKISYAFIYTEPNGTEVNGQGTIAIESGDRVQYNGGSHTIVSKSVDAEQDVVEIKITQQGMDNNREAQIDHVFQRKGDVVSITRYILREGATAPFVRHTYTFKLDE